MDINIPENEIADLKEMCESVGISFPLTRQFHGLFDEILKMELLFSNVTTLHPVSIFKNLNKLIVMSAEVETLRGVSSLENLTELWVAECKLKTIDHLKGNTKLKSLYLYSNQISQIRGLSKCRLLEVLWLSSNKITVVENLDYLTHLKELNLADNQITRMGEGLKNNGRIEVLNLSGNKLLFVKDIISLDLPRLKNLSLADPLYLPNPLCSLCNYIMCLMFHFKTLHRLDGQLLSELDIKKEVEAVRIKKLYYSMRLEMIKRSRWDISHKLEVFHTEIQQRLSSKLKNITYTKKELERVMLLHNLLTSRTSLTNKEVSFYLMEADNRELAKDLDREKFTHKRAVLKSMLRQYSDQKAGYVILYKKAAADVDEETNIQLKLFDLELGSFGTIKFQPGKTEDSWFQACQDLVLARFCINHYNAIGINGIKVKKVTKIINESLELTFNKKVTTLQRNDNLCELLTNKKIGYYFLLLKDCEQMDTMLQVIENGCTSLSNSDTCRNFEHKNQGLVGLTNSVHHLDSDRISGHSSSKISEKLEDISFHKGSILLMKTYTGFSVEVPESSSPFEKFDGFDVCFLRLTNMSPHDSGSPVVSDKTCACDLKCFEYYVLDPEMVIPAYLIEFEYIYKINPVSPFVIMLRDGQQPLVRADKLTGDDEIETLAPDHLNATHFTWDDIVTKMCSMSAGNLSELEEISLHGMQIIDFPSLTTLISVQKLVLSFNCLTNLRGLANLASLKILDVSYNYLVTLEGLLGIPNLVKLNLSHNQLRKDTDIIDYLIYNTPNLTSLKIENNPWPIGSLIYYRLSTELIHLSRLDGKPVERKQPEEPNPESEFSLEFAFLMRRVSTVRRAPSSLYLKNNATLLTSLKPPKLIHPFDNYWTLKVTTVDLSHLSLNNVTGLSKLESLRWANISHNNLGNIKDMERCIQIEELCLDHNHITTLDGISNLKHLMNLNVDNNEISSLDGWHLDKCPCLQTLSVSYNQIASLDGLQNCSGLIELYLINNKIESIFSFAIIKHLQSLSVFMIIGNPVTDLYPDYRHTILFNAPNLLGLDGKCVDTMDILSAKEILGGRLTIDFIKDHVKNKSLSAIVYLDLPNCSLQSVNLADGSELPNLKSINLEKNYLTSFSGLVRLNGLKVICLNNNHIESLHPRSSKSAHSSFDALQSSGDTLLDDTQVLKSLEVLHLAYNDITHTETLQLHKLPSLKSLFLQGNKIKSMTGLEGLWYLEHLVLDRNQISVIGKGELEALCWLQELHLQENLIKDLPTLYGPSGLQKLFLGSNRIKDIDELFKLSKLPSLEEVSFVGNSVTRRALHRSILIHFVSTLEIVDGIPVTAEERIKAGKYFLELGKTESGEECSTTTIESGHRSLTQ